MHFKNKEKMQENYLKKKRKTISYLNVIMSTLHIDQNIFFSNHKIHRPTYT